MTLRSPVVALAMAGAIAGCASGAGASSSPGQVQELTVYAASSLRDVLAAAGSAYEAVDPGTTLTLATDSSSTLRTQIEQGAPADVFLAADREDALSLVADGLADGPSIDFAGNRLTIVVPADNPGLVESPADLGRPGLKIVAAGDNVPITDYALQVIANLARKPAFPAGFYDAYASNIVSREENVKAVLAKVELGEGDAAIVYVTDAATASNVTTIEIPAWANVHATYAGVVVKTSSRSEAAHAFLDWLAGPEGGAVMTEFGFLPPT
jgi:molybdate transport system substrate-binding protein